MGPIEKEWNKIESLAVERFKEEYIETELRNIIEIVKASFVAGCFVTIIASTKFTDESVAADVKFVMENVNEWEKEN